MKLVHWPLMGGLLHLVQQGGAWAGPQPAQSPPCCTICDIPPIKGQCINQRVDGTNDPLFCGFNVGLPINGLTALIYLIEVSISQSMDRSHRSFDPFFAQNVKILLLLLLLLRM